MKKLNINDAVWVKVTDEGLAYMKAVHEAFCLQAGIDNIKWTPPQTDEDGYCRMQLWVVMNELGPRLTLGDAPPIDMEIRIDDEHLKDV